MHKGWRGVGIVVEQATDGFSIGVLAERTGLTPTLLRTWENRFGFPAGTRSAAGHRRFTDADVDLVRQVQELRAGGVGLSAAVEAVRRRRRRPVESVHAVMARDFPHLGVQRLGRRALVAASYAVEDEALARAERPIVLGTFQVGDRFADQRRRWDELARTAAWSAVVADFDDSLPADPSAIPARCQLAEGSPLRREWTVVTVSDTRAALVSAWEVPGATPALRVGRQHPPSRCRRGGAGAGRRGACRRGRAARARRRAARRARPRDRGGRRRPDVAASHGPPGPRLAAQWLRSASISSDFLIVERPSMPSSPARLRSSATVRSS